MGPASERQHEAGVLPRLTVECFIDCVFGTVISTQPTSFALHWYNDSVSWAFFLRKRACYPKSKFWYSGLLTSQIEKSGAFVSVLTLLVHYDFLPSSSLPALKSW